MPSEPIKSLSNDLINHDAECAYLGSIIVSGFIPDEPPLAPDDFALHSHGVIFGAMQAIQAEGMNIDPIVLPARLRKQPQLEDPPEGSWEGYITRLTTYPSTSFNAPEYARIIADLSQRRKAVSFAQEIARRAANRDAPFALPEMPSPVSSASSHRLEVMSAAEMLAPMPPVDYLVDGLIAPANVVLWFGAPESKKTWTTMVLGACVATGTPFLGLKTRQAPVLYLNADAGRASFRQRFRCIVSGMGLDAELPFWGIHDHSFQLTNALDVQGLIQAIRQYEAKLVFIDTLKKTTENVEENSATEMQRPMNVLREIANETDAAVMPIHHTGKYAAGPRGSNAILASVDVALQVESARTSKYVDLSTAKARDVEDVRLRCRVSSDSIKNPTWFKLEAAEPLAEKEVQRRASEQFVLDYLEKNGWTAKTAIVAAVATQGICGIESARNAVESMAREGTIERKNAGGHGVAAIYGLVEDGQDNSDDE